MKGTIPSEVVEDLQLGDGDVIEWELVKDQGGKIEARVRRAA